MAQGAGEPERDAEADEEPTPMYPNDLARRVAKAVGVSTHRPPHGSPGPS